MHYSCEIEQSIPYHHWASLMMPNGDPQDGFFYPTITLKIESFILYTLNVNIRIQERLWQIFNAMTRQCRYISWSYENNGKLHLIYMKTFSWVSCKLYVVFPSFLASVKSRKITFKSYYYYFFRYCLSLLSILIMFSLNLRFQLITCRAFRLWRRRHEVRK